MSRPRIGPLAQKILEHFLQHPCQETYVTELAARLELRPGSVSKALNRFEKAGWLTARWGEMDPDTPDQPRHRYYQLTAQHHRLVWAALRNKKPNGGDK